MTTTTANADAGDERPDARVYRVLGEQYLHRSDRDHVDAVGTWAAEWRRTAPSLPRSFESALTRIEEGAAADEETLRTAFTHLFRGISEGNTPAPPYESLYVDGSFYSETTTEIQQGYRWAGTDVDDSHGNEPPDHLGLELQFLGELVAMDPQERGPDGPDVEDATRWILDEHLARWVPPYRDRLQEEDPPEYYGGILDLTVAVIEYHHEQIA
ncbi:MAG: molecular chaperone TorD family protein [Haloarculaceae archaeon]